MATYAYPIWREHTVASSRNERPLPGARPRTDISIRALSSRIHYNATGIPRTIVVVRERVLLHREQLSAPRTTTFQERPPCLPLEFFRREFSLLRQRNSPASFTRSQNSRSIKGDLETDTQKRTLIDTSTERYQKPEFLINKNDNGNRQIACFKSASMYHCKKRIANLTWRYILYSARR